MNATDTGEDYGRSETTGTVDLEMHQDPAEVGVWWPGTAVGDDAPPVVTLRMPCETMTPAAARELADELVNAADRCV